MPELDYCSLDFITSRCLGYDPALLKRKNSLLREELNKPGTERARENQPNECPA